MPKYQILGGIISGAGITILIVCGYLKTNPFPFANIVGLALTFFGVVIITFYKKIPWVKGRHYYPDNMGGPNP